MDIKKIAQDLFDKEICELEKVKGKISDSLEIVVNLILNSKGKVEIGRASCRERVCQYV